MADTFYPLDRKRIRYADTVRAQAPEARRRYFDDQAIGLQRSALTQEQENFDKSLELQREQAKIAEEQAKRSEAIGAAGVGVSAYPYIKKGVKGLYDLTLGGDEAAATESAPNPAPLTNESIINDVYTPEYPVGDFAAYPREQPIIDAISPAHEIPEYSALVREGSQIPTAGVGEAALAPGYEAGVTAVNNLYAPAYTTPAVEALAAEGAASVAPGVGEAAIPAVSGGQAAGEVGATAGSSAAEGTSFASGLGTAALMYLPYGIFKAFQKNKPSLRSYWPHMTHAQKLELLKTDPEYVARSGVVPGLGLYRESSVRDLGSGIGTPDAADYRGSGYSAGGVSNRDAVDGSNRPTTPLSSSRNSMPFERNYNLGTVKDVFGESFDLGGKGMSFNTQKGKSINAENVADYFSEGF